MNKKCVRCGETKPSKDFNKNSSREHGLSDWCKACRRAYRQKNRDKIRVRNRKWLEANRELARELTNEWRRRTGYNVLYGRGSSAYLKGQGICLYCNEINPFMLNNHHVFGKENDLIITLCANHHELIHHFPKMLEDWF